MERSRRARRGCRFNAANQSIMPTSHGPPWSGCKATMPAPGCPRISGPASSTPGSLDAARATVGPLASARSDIGARVKGRCLAGRRSHDRRQVGGRRKMPGNRDRRPGEGSPIPAAASLGDTGGQALREQAAPPGRAPARLPPGRARAAARPRVVWERAARERLQCCSRPTGRPATGWPSSSAGTPAPPPLQSGHRHNGRGNPPDRLIGQHRSAPG
ncbi:hypothetical protein SAMN05519103_04092 [Rhizobiales bacterium GAS113]|jgi:hypothetical protein|nr:hypothetical protein SAMN05519103_04092 [Rhizobiales bacterium GAS113]